MNAANDHFESRLDRFDDDLHQFGVREPEREIDTGARQLGAGSHRERTAPLAEAERRLAASEANVIDAARFGTLRCIAST